LRQLKSLPWLLRHLRSLPVLLHHAFALAALSSILLFGVCVCLCVCARACVAWSVRVCGVSMLMHMSEESVWMHISGLDRASRQAGRCRTGAACTGAACTGAACTGAACFGACQAGTRVSTRCSSMAWARGSIKSVCTLRPSDISRHRRRAGVSMGSIGAWQDGCWAGGGATGM
jgi:hypothetical protein